LPEARQSLKALLVSLIERALAELRERGELPREAAPAIAVERARDPAHGDYATPIALGLARGLGGRRPRELAEALVGGLPASEALARVEVAGPGFINFFLRPEAFQAVVADVLAAGVAYGRLELGAGRKVQVEFVSANPTGPLHVGHGRHAAFGASVANLLEAAGFTVEREYYVNDAGRQMDILALSVWLRYLELGGERLPFPASGYRGEYVREIARDLARRHGERFRVAGARARDGLLPDAPNGDAERHVDASIERARTLLGSDGYAEVLDFATEAMIADIRDDLEGFGVTFHCWARESEVVASGAVERTLERLRASDHAYDRDGALWLRTSTFGDEKDRVLVRENGRATYFLNDLAYHVERKFACGFTHLIDVWGADHHGYVARMKAALAALGEDPERLEVLLVQFVNLFRGGRKVQMSTRSGEFVTLRELREEVGTDAARFFYVMRKHDQHLDFDLDLAASRSSDNPVYYVQYAHARIASVMRQLAERGHSWSGRAAHLERLTEREELACMKTLARYPEVVETAAFGHDPHHLVSYLRELANDFHACYNAHTFLVGEEALRSARLALAAATGQVLRNGLMLLGVCAPESM